MLGLELRMQSASMTIYCDFPDNLTNFQTIQVDLDTSPVWHQSANPPCSRTSGQSKSCQPSVMRSSANFSAWKQSTKEKILYVTECKKSP